MIHLYYRRAVRPVLPRWLVLIHQIPPRPSYLRVKVGRRLQALGAVAVKNSVYVLPRSDQSREDFQWVRREILAGHGEATIAEARFLEGHSDTDVEALFRAAREADYSSLAREARDLERAVARAGRGVSGHQHQSGTCRMGSDPKTSVVDASCRIHDVPNVFVIDASVHVTNGGFNPVLTIYANAYRASDLLVRAWKGGGLRG